MKKLLTQLAKAMLLLLLMLVFVQANAQKRYAPIASTDYAYTIENDVQTSPTEMTFELWIRDTDAATPFELSIIQAGVLVNNAIIASNEQYLSHGDLLVIKTKYPLALSGHGDACQELRMGETTS